MHLQRSHLQISDEAILENTEKAISAAAITTVEILKIKLKITTDALESLTRFGPDNEEETQDKGKLLYDFWSLNRALGNFV